MENPAGKAGPGPKGSSRRTWALPLAVFAAGVLCLAAGWLPWGDFGTLAGRTVPILAFVLFMTVVTELADDAGLFRAIAARLAALGRGSVLSLWLLAAALATVSTVFLSLDATVVLVTPIVVRLARHAGTSALPFAMATVWLANTASLLLPVSNLTNLLARSRLEIAPVHFAGLVWAPALAGVLLPVALLAAAFRKQLRGRFAPGAAEPARDKVLLTAAACTLGALLPALVSGIPVEYPAGAAAAVLLAFYLVRRRTVLHWSMLPWRPLLLTIGLFMLIQTLQSHGAGTALRGVAGTGDGLPALLAVSGLGAAVANAINNLPAYLALEPVADTPLRLAALLIGVNLGPLVTPWASLATLLWHDRLAALGLRVSWGAYALAGAGAVLLLVPAAAVALWAASGATH